MASVTPEERERFLRHARELAAHESDEYGSPEERASAIAAVNALRARDGRAPLRDDRDDSSGLAVHKRARALGLRRPRG